MPLHTIATSPDTADVIVLDLYAVIQGTDNRMLERLNALGKNGKAVIVSGCLPQVSKQRVLGACPRAILIPPGRRASFIDILSAMREGLGGMEENAQGASRLPEGVIPPPADSEDIRSSSAGFGFHQIPEAGGVFDKQRSCLERVRPNDERTRISPRPIPPGVETPGVSAKFVKVVSARPGFLIGESA